MINFRKGFSRVTTPEIFDPKLSFGVLTDAPRLVAHIMGTEHYREMPIRIATLSDLEDWAALRAQLWPDVTIAEHRTEAAAILAKSTHESTAFVSEGDGTGLHAFAEAALRHDYVNGCETSPVAFLEGIYVRPDNRRSGVGRRLLMAVQSWACERGCTELASDALLENVESRAFHAAFGLEETERVVFFRKSL